MKLFLCIFFIFFFLAEKSIAQNKTIDSLKLALKNAKNDTTRCNLLSQLAETASDEAWPAFNDALFILAEKNKNSAPELKKNH
jgi:hypothetical protein